MYIVKYIYIYLEFMFYFFFELPWLNSTTFPGWEKRRGWRRSWAAFLDSLLSLYWKISACRGPAGLFWGRGGRSTDGLNTGLAIPILGPITLGEDETNHWPSSGLEMGPKWKWKWRENWSIVVRQVLRTTEDEQEVTWHSIGSQQAFSRHSSQNCQDYSALKKMQATLFFLSLCVHSAISPQ